MKEFDWITRYLRPLASPKGAAQGLLDDAAHFHIAKDLLPAEQGKNSEQRLVISCDTLVEGVHFFHGDDPLLLAKKALRVNLSDIAAKGARPYGFFSALSLPRDLPKSWYEAFSAGLAQDMQHYDLALFGGDTTRAPHDLTITITMLGLTQRSLLRSGALAGDLIAVGGKIGQGYFGLLAAQKQAGLSATEREALAHYHCPEPQVALGQALSRCKGVHASMDISDGLLADLRHMAEASALLAKVDATQIPLIDTQEAIQEQLSAGDDYLLLCALNQEALTSLQQQGFMLTKIGRFEQARDEAAIGVEIYDAQGQKMMFEKFGYSHD